METGETRVEERVIPGERLERSSRPVAFCYLTVTLKLDRPIRSAPREIVTITFQAPSIES